MGQTASKDRRSSSNDVIRSPEDFPGADSLASNDDFIVVDICQNGQEAPSDKTSQFSQSNSIHSNENQESDVFVVDLSNHETPPQVQKYCKINKSILLRMTARSYEDLTQNLSPESAYYEQKSFLTNTSTCSFSPSPLKRQTSLCEIDEAIRRNLRRSSTPQDSAPSTQSLPSSPLNTRGLCASSTDSSPSCYVTATEGCLSPEFEEYVRARALGLQHDREFDEIIVSLSEVSERSPRPEQSLRAGPRAMPTKRAGGQSSSRAEDDSRLLEPGSSREDDESPKSGSAASKSDQTSDSVRSSAQQAESGEGGTDIAEEGGAEVGTGAAETGEGVKETSAPAATKEASAREKSAVKGSSHKSDRHHDKDKPARSRSRQTVGSDTTGTSGGQRKSPGGVSGKSPTRGPPRQKVVYYQNRFITIPIDDGGRRSGGGGGSGSSVTSAASQQASGRAPVTSSGSTTQGEASEEANQARTNMDLEGMPIDLDPVTPAQPVPRLGARGLAKTQSLFAKVTAVLQDNRLKSGTAEIQEQIKEMNKNQEESHKVLKKILNIIFITTGVSLFLGVVVVIIYTTIDPDGPNS